MLGGMTVKAPGTVVKEVGQINAQNLISYFGKL